MLAPRLFAAPIASVMDRIMMVSVGDGVGRSDAHPMINDADDLSDVIQRRQPTAEERTRGRKRTFDVL